MNMRVVESGDHLSAVAIDHLDSRSEPPWAFVEHALYRAVIDKKTAATRVLRIERRNVRVDKERLHRLRFFGDAFRSSTPSCSKTPRPPAPACNPKIRLEYYRCAAPSKER